MTISNLRHEYHQQICCSIIRIRKDPKNNREYPNFADGTSKASTAIALGVVQRLGYASNYQIIAEQHAGGLFQMITKDFLMEAFTLISHLRPGNWEYRVKKTSISGYDQYEHISHLKEVVENDSNLRSALGGDYVVAPDIVIGRIPVYDKEINSIRNVINSSENISKLTPLRADNQKVLRPILHASISCKWTIRSDRSQNTRTEALNLIRNRKGHLPHIVAVTAEPLPTRIASLALGIGDLDCVYHFALPELQSAIEDVNNEDQLDMLRMLVEGRRLRDISDLPFDLAA